MLTLQDLSFLFLGSLLLLLMMVGCLGSLLLFLLLAVTLVGALVGEPRGRVVHRRVLNARNARQRRALRLQWSRRRPHPSDRPSRFPFAFPRSRAP